MCKFCPTLPSNSAPPTLPPLKLCPTHLTLRLARWFAYHLSNYKYQWDWSRWVNCFQGPPDHASIRFISEVFSRCSRSGALPGAMPGVLLPGVMPGVMDLCMFVCRVVPSKGPSLCKHPAHIYADRMVWWGSLVCWYLPPEMLGFCWL